MPTLTKAESKLVDELVKQAEKDRSVFTTLLMNLSTTFSSDAELMKYVHSMKWRVKDTGHLRDKLIRQLADSNAAGRKFAITPDNLFVKINDLAGFRILHLYTRQFEHINRCLLRIFDEQMYRILEGPAARTWDDESRDYFKSIHTRYIKSGTLYTSVHYVIAPNYKKRYTCEVQVRTLAEELWGEVDHTINYPHPSSSLPCREQIKVLARVTSSCTRLVDSIFSSHLDHHAGRKRRLP